VLELTPKPVDHKVVVFAEATDQRRRRDTCGLQIPNSIAAGEAARVRCQSVEQIDKGLFTARGVFRRGSF
jgi:hypothetical protein